VRGETGEEIAGHGIVDEGKIVELNKEVMKAHLNTVELNKVEETLLNELLDVEVDRMWKVGRYERKADRAGSNRRLPRKAGEVSLKVLKLRRILVFEKAIIESYM
jgi:transposase-like protein